MVTRAGRPLARPFGLFLAVGGAAGGSVGSVIGLVIGISVSLPTAPIAALEIGVPGLLLGALVGLVTGTGWLVRAVLRP